jgi:hypothetical protein
MDLRPVGIHRLSDVEERRALVVLDLDQFDRLAGSLLVDRCYGRDRLAFVTDFVDGEQRLVGRDPERLEVPVDIVGDVLVSDERSAFVQSVPRTRTSSTYCVCPVTWATPS